MVIETQSQDYSAVSSGVCGTESVGEKCFTVVGPELPRFRDSYVFSRGQLDRTFVHNVPRYFVCCLKWPRRATLPTAAYQCNQSTSLANFAGAKRQPPMLVHQLPDSLARQKPTNASMYTTSRLLARRLKYGTVCNTINFEIERLFALAFGVV
jgi:hypothetical protein